MKIRQIASAIAVCATVLMTSGCGTIYSTQSYGTFGTQRVSQGATKTDVFANLGQPNAIYRTEDGEVFVYKYAQGKNILGLYAEITRTDFVVVMDKKDVVQYAGEVPVGDGKTILAFPGLDATHPVRTSTLLFEPENYRYEATLNED